MQNLSGRNPHIFLHRMVQAYFHSRTCQCFYLHIITLTPARSALSGRPFFVHIYFTGISFSLPPTYGRSATGTLTLPSALRLFSKNAISILGGATTVLFKVCAKYLLPSLPFTRIFNLLACASPRFEQLPTSKYFFYLGDHASTSQDFTFRSARSPEQHSSVRTGISRLLNRSTVFCHSLSYHILDSSGLQTTIISCFSNW